MNRPAYRLWIKGGWYFILAEDGTILFDSERNYTSTSGEWKIIGIATRHNSHRLVSLKAAANGEPIGQGWVHDLDHGTHRMWGMPKHHRAVNVEVLK